MTDKRNRPPKTADEIERQYGKEKRRVRKKAEAEQLRCRVLKSWGRAIC